MADQNFDDAMRSELESRLDDLFGADDHAAEVLKTDEPPEDYPLAELKSLVLSIDWEITDEVLEKFLGQIKQLKTKYRKDKTIFMFLQILGSLGVYIKTHRGKAHPKTFKILNSVFSKLDAVALSKTMKESEKKKILSVELKKFNALKSQISQSKPAVRRKKAPPTPENKKAPTQKPAEDVVVVEPGKPRKLAKKERAESETDHLIPADALADAVREIKKYMQAEFKALREELILMRKQR